MSLKNCGVFNANKEFVGQPTSSPSTMREHNVYASLIKKSHITRT